MKIGRIDTSEKVLIVAEIGNNHEGSFQVARDLVLRAKEAGVDAVKFQTFIPELFVSSSEAARLTRLKSFQLKQEDFVSLQEEAARNDLLFISTPLDLESARFLAPLVDSFKIASGDNNFYQLIEFVARFQKPMIISGGLADISQLQKTKSMVEKIWGANRTKENLAILHCVTSYPVPLEEANLGAIPDLIAHLGDTIGYSDHTLGIEACLLATALGARIIEKHFTLDKNYSSFRDHQLSADPTEMKQLVESIRRAEKMIGEHKRTIQPCEKEFQIVARRSLAASRPLKKGEPLDSDSMLWLRPATGIQPGREADFLGKHLNRSIGPGEIISASDLA